MRHLSLPARLILLLVAALSVCAYLVIADIGVNAGLVHHGVRVGHVDIGRMTDGEALDAVESAGEQMAETPIVFTADGFQMYSWTPAELGWQPRATLMVERALKVGRRESVGRSVWERVRSYFGGLTVRWERPKGWRVERAIADVAGDGFLLGREVDTERMARMIRHAVRSWPRREFYEIPLVTGS
jgi:hypothetical protein